MKHSSFVLITIGLIASLTLTACSGIATSPTAAAQSNEATPDKTAGMVSAEGRLRPVQTAELAFAAPGLVTEVLVSEGDTVSAGDVLARLDGAEAIQAQVAAAGLEKTLALQDLDQLNEHAFLLTSQSRTALQQAQTSYEQVARSWRPNSLNDQNTLETALEDYVEAEEAVREDQDDLESLLTRDPDAPKVRLLRDQLARDEEQREAAYTSLVKTFGDLTEESIAAEDIQLVQTIAVLENARQEYEAVQSGPDPDLLAVIEARFSTAEAQTAAAEAALRNLELRAPISGVIAHWTVKTGAAVTPYVPVGEIGQTSGWIVETTDLTELDVVRVEIGAPATVLVDALPGKSFSGTVTAIQPLGMEDAGDIQYQVQISLDEGDPRWLWNMTVEAQIVVE